MRHAVLTAAPVSASAASSAVETYRDIEIAAERRRGGVQFNKFVPSPGLRWPCWTAGRWRRSRSWEYVCERTYRALAIEELRGGLQ